MVKKFDDMFSHLDTILVCGVRTDGHLARAVSIYYTLCIRTA